MRYLQKAVASIENPPPISQSAGRENIERVELADGPQVRKSATQQTASLRSDHSFRELHGPPSFNSSSSSICFKYANTFCASSSSTLLSAKPA